MKPIRPMRATSGLSEQNTRRFWLPAFRKAGLRNSWPKFQPNPSFGLQNCACKSQALAGELASATMTRKHRWAKKCSAHISEVSSSKPQHPPGSVCSQCFGEKDMTIRSPQQGHSAKLEHCERSSSSRGQIQHLRMMNYDLSRLTPRNMASQVLK